jgi:hypothetical protein
LADPETYGLLHSLVSGLVILEASREACRKNLARPSVGLAALPAEDVALRADAQLHVDVRIERLVLIDASADLEIEVWGTNLGIFEEAR